MDQTYSARQLWLTGHSSKVPTKVDQEAEEAEPAVGKEAEVQTDTDRY